MASRLPHAQRAVTRQPSRQASPRVSAGMRTNSEHWLGDVKDRGQEAIRLTQRRRVGKGAAVRRAHAELAYSSRMLAAETITAAAP
jgi:hypothetical protein